MTFRILHVLDHSVPLQSGYSFRTLSLLREQRALGWETFQVTTPKHYASDAEEEDVSGFHFYRTHLRPALLGRVPVVNQAAVIMATAQRLKELIPKLRPDVIHAHSPMLNAFAALRAARKFGLPVVYEVRAFWEDAAVDHGTTREGSFRYRISQSLESFVLRRADAVTTICEGLAGEIRSRGVSPDRISVIPNAVDIENFDLIDQPDNALLQRLGLGPGPILGFVGSLYNYEGLEFLIRALPHLSATHPRAQIVLVGGGPAEASLKHLANSLGIAGRVHFIGRVPHEEVRRYYSIIDILAYPRISIRLTELVTPLKPLEAMALGRLFIASEVGGHRELIPDVLRPHLFRAGDPVDLARAARELLGARERWPALKAEGRAHVTQHRTWQRSVAGYIPVYGSTVPSRAAA